MLHAQLAEHLDDDGGRRYRQHGAEEDRIHRLPAEVNPDLVANPQHQRNLRQGSDESGGADLAEFLQAEFQAQRKQQEDHAQLCQDLNRAFIRDQRKRWRMWADDDAGDDITKHHRLFETVEQHRHDTGDQHDHGQILDKHFDGMMHGQAFLVKVDKIGDNARAKKGQQDARRAAL